MGWGRGVGEVAIATSGYSGIGGNFLNKFYNIKIYICDTIQSYAMKLPQCLKLEFLIIL